MHNHIDTYQGGSPWYRLPRQVQILNYVLCEGFQEMNPHSVYNFIRNSYGANFAPLSVANGVSAVCAPLSVLCEQGLETQ